jgi:hypothetical protein
VVPEILNLKAFVASKKPMLVPELSRPKRENPLTEFWKRTAFSASLCSVIGAFAAEEAVPIAIAAGLIVPASLVATEAAFESAVDTRVDWDVF